MKKQYFRVVTSKGNTLHFRTDESAQDFIRRAVANGLTCTCEPVMIDPVAMLREKGAIR
jgi:hypothetical protein